MLPASHPSALVIGSGFSGLAAAVFLDQLGFQITVLEKKPVLGGRTYAFCDRKTSTWVDNGQHLMMGAYHETIRLLELIGAKHTLHFQKKISVPLVSDENRFFEFSLPALPSPWNFLFGMMRFPLFSFRDKWKILRMGFLLKRLKKKNLDDPTLDQTVDEWLSQMGQSPRARKNFWDILTLATLNDEPTITSARGLAAVLIRGFLGNKNNSQLVIPKNNLNECLAKPAKTYLEMRGHTLKQSCAVTKIHILNNQVRSLELETGEHLRADYYFSAVPFRNLLHLIPKGFVCRLPYFNQLTRLKSAPIVSINLWFDRDFLPHDFVGVAGRMVHWYFNKNRIQDVSHPPYHYMGVVSGAYSLIDASREEILKIAKKEMAEIFPESRHSKLLHALVNKEREATLSATVEAEKVRPPQKSPFENFYVIGDWTKTGLPATIESAVLSAHLAVDNLKSARHF